MKFNREEIIERLTDDKTDTVTQWALQDTESLWEYVSNAENLDALDDETLRNLYELTFDEKVD